MNNDNKKTPECQSDEVTFVVYVMWCNATGKYYVGVTSQEEEMRIRQHKNGKKQFVDREIQRTGWDEAQWDWWVLENFVPAENITAREQYWVAFFNSVYPNGYNLTIGGIKHFQHSKATCKKISKALSGTKRKPFTAEHRANISKSRSGEKNPNFGKPAWNRGIPCTPTAKKKIRKKLTGRKRPQQSEKMKGENNPNYGKSLSDSTKAKISKGNKGKTAWNKGKKHKPESIAKMRGRKVSDETREKNRQAHIGKHPSDETRAKLSESRTGEKNPFYGKHHSEETKAKLREIARAREAKKRAEREAAALAAAENAENQDKTS